MGKAWPRLSIYPELTILLYTHKTQVSWVNTVFSNTVEVYALVLGTRRLSDVERTFHIVRGPGDGVKQGKTALGSWEFEQFECIFPTAFTHGNTSSKDGGIQYTHA